MADTLDVITLAEAEADMGDQDDTLLAAYITSVSEWPVDSVTTVTEYQGSTAVTVTEEAVTTSPSPGFLCDFSTGALYRRAGKLDYCWYRGRRNIVVTYEAGRYADTASVDERFKRAALITLRNLWQKEQGMGTVTFGPDGQPIVGATFALPNAAAAFIREDLRVSGHAD